MPSNKPTYNHGRQTSIKIPTSKVGAWLTNVGKSIGYSAQDVLSDVLPATSEHVTSAAENIREFQQKMREVKLTSKRMQEIADANVYYQLGSDAVKNAKEALKTGKFYDRSKMTYDDGFSDADFGDFEFDDSFDMDVSDGEAMGSSTVEDDAGKVNVTNIKVNMDIGETSPLVQSLNHQTQISIDTAERAERLSKINNTTLINQLNGLTNKLDGNLGALNENIATVSSVLSTTVTQHATLSAKYYNDSMEVFNKIYDSLNTIVQSYQKPVAEEPKPYENALDLFGANGTLNLGTYSQTVKKQFKKSVEGNLILSQIANMATDTDTLKMMVQNPLAFVPKKLVSTIITSSVQETAKAFDETLSQTLIAGLHRVRSLSSSDNPIARFFGEVFGIGNKVESEPSKADYQRGKVDWDGESRKTLNEVIPYYLRKITAALTGTQEMVFDYNQGTFRTMRDVTENYERDKRRKLTSGLSDVTSDYTDFAKSLTFRDNRSREDAVKFADEFTARLVRSNGNPLSKDTNDSFLTSIAKMMSVSEDDDNAKLFSSWLDAQANNYIMSLSSKVLESQKEYSQYMRDMGSGKIQSNYMYMNNGTTFDDSMVKDRFGKSTGTVDYSKSILGGARDKYGKTSVEYLRDILTTLLTGIKVYNVGGIGSKEPGKSPIITKSSEMLKRMKADVDKVNDVEMRVHARANKTTSQEDIEKAKQAGTYIDPRSVDSNIIRARAEDFRLSQAERDNEKDNSIDWFLKMTGLKENDPLSKIINKVSKIVTQKPSETVNSVFKHADDFLFRVVFGGGNNDVPLMKRAGAYVKGYFQTFTVFLNDKVFKPLEEALFGKDGKGGLINQLKQTKFAQDIKGAVGKARTYLFGTKVDGKYQNGLFSDIATELSEMFGAAKESLFGKGPDSVLSNVKATFKEKIDSALSFFGMESDKSKPKSETPIKDAMDRAHDMIVERSHNFLDNVFGKDDERKKYLSDVQSDLGGKRGKLGAGAVVGALSSFIMPGGLFFNALLGLSTTAVKESKTLQGTLFGYTDASTGEERAGIINKNLVELYKNNKTGLKLGIGVASLAKFGLIPSMLAPGGVIGSALLGLGASVVYNSDAFQTLMFGEYDEASGDRVGGLSTKFKSAFGEFDKGRFIDVGVGAGVGLLGGLFLPGGPLMGAILGGSLGFASSTEAFQKFLFGDYNDPNDKSKGRNREGILGKAYNAVINPMVDAFKVQQIKFFGFLERSVFIPLQTAVAPIAYEFKHVFDVAKNAIGNMVEYVKQTVFKPIGDVVHTTLVDPLLKLGKTLFSATTKIVGTLVSAPFRALEVVSFGLNRKQQKRGVNKWVDDTLGTTFTGEDSEGNKVSFMGRMKALGKFFAGSSNGERNAARFSPAGAGYGYDSKERSDRLKNASRLYQQYEIENRNNKNRLSREEWYRQNGYEDVIKRSSRLKNTTATTAKPVVPTEDASATAKAVANELPTEDGAIKVKVINLASNRKVKKARKGENGAEVSETNDKVPDNAAFGKIIPKLGEYVLSPGEVVIPNDPSQQLTDYANEKAYISNKYGDADAVGSFAFGGIVGGTTSNDVRNAAKRAARQEAKDKRAALREKEKAELEQTKLSGSYANRMAKWKDEHRYQEQQSTLTKMRMSLEAIAATSTSYASDWSEVFGKKKGLITLGVLALGVPLINLISKALNFIDGWKNGDFIPDIVDRLVDRVKTNFEDVGGLTGVVNNVMEHFANMAETTSKLFQSVRRAVTGGGMGALIDGYQEFITPGGEVNEFTDVKIRGTGRLAGKAVIGASNVVNTMFGNDITETVGKNAAASAKTKAQTISSAAKNIGRTAARGADFLWNKVVGVGPTMAGRSTGFLGASKEASILLKDAAVGTGKVAKSAASKLGSGYVRMANAVSPGYGDDIAKGATKIASIANKGISKVSSGTKTVVSGVKSGADDLLKTATGLFDNLVKWLSNQKLFKGLGSGIKKGIGKIFGTVGTLDGFIKKNAVKISEKLAKTAFGKSTKIGARMASSVASAGLVDVAFAAFGLLDGATSAANLFQVDDTYVNSRMRAISAVFRALLNTTPGMFIDIINEVFYSITGTSFVRELAVMLYELISTDDEIAELTKGLTEFDDKWNAQVETEYSEWIKTDAGKEAIASGEYTGDWAQDEATFKASSNATSKATYNAQQHQTLTTKIATKFTSLANTLTDEDTALGRAVNSTLNNLKDVVKGIGGAAAGFFVSPITTMFTKVKGIGDVFSPSGYWANDTAEGKTDVFSSMKTIASTVSKFLLSPVALVYGMGQTIWGGVKTLFGKVTSGFNALKEKTNFSLSTITGIGDVLSSDYWTPPTDDPNNPMSPVQRASFYGMRALTFIPGLAIGAAKSLGTLLSPVLEPIRTAMVSAMGWDLNEDGQPVDANDNPMTMVAKIAHIGAKAVQMPIKLIGKVGSFLGQYVGPIASAVGNIFSAAITHTVTAAEAIDNPLSIFSKSYWTMKEEDYGPANEIGVISKIGFYASRIALAPIASTFGMLKLAFNSISTLFSAEKQAKFQELMDTSALDNGGYKNMTFKELWTIPEAKNDSVFNILGNLVARVSRVFYTIGWAINKVTSLFANIAEDGLFNTIKKLFSGAGDLDDIDGHISGNGVVTGGNGGNGTLNNFPYYSQNDESIRTKSYRYSANKGTGSATETMGNRGCGPTAMAMVNDAINGGPSSPLKMARLAEAQGYSTESGTTPNYFTNVGRQLGMSVTEAPTTPANIYSMVGNEPIVLLGRSAKTGSPYTSSGHYVVAVGSDKHGNIIVNDPRGKQYSGKYSMQQILDGSSRMWGFRNQNIPGGNGKINKTIGSVFAGNGIPDTNAGAEEQIAAVLATAQSYVGYKEKKSNNNLDNFTANAGNNNYTRFCRDYNEYMGTTFASAEWCAMFVSIVFVETFGLEQAKKLLCGNLFCYTPTGAQYFTNKNRFTTTNPQPGDVVFFKWKTSSRICHVGIVKSVNGDGTITTIEGNTKVNGQGGVYEKVRPMDSEIAGYGRPQYNGVTVQFTKSTTSVSDSSSKNSTGAFSFVSKIADLASTYSNAVLGTLFGTTTGESGSSSYSDSALTTELTGNSTAQKIWNYLRGKGYSKAAAAGVMGNLYAESGLLSNNVQNTFEGRVGSDDAYTRKVDNGSYSRDQFMKDSAGYGLAQWTYHSRKAGLYDRAKSNNASIADLGVQLDYLNSEASGSMPNYKNIGNVREASNRWLFDFERPADQGSRVQNTRAGYAQKYYDEFGGNGDGPVTGYHKSYDRDYQTLIHKDSQYSGNGNSIVGSDEIVELLSSMLIELQGTNMGISKFNDKELKVENTPVVITDNSSQNTVVANNNNRTAIPNHTTKNNSFVTSDKYSLAKRIAQGSYVNS